MAGTTPAAFDPKPKYLSQTIDCIAASAILAGQVVAFNGTGVAWTVEPSDGVTTAAVVGVALHSQATVGGHVAVAGPGSILKVCEGDGANIDAGDTVVTSVSTATGCVSTAAQADEYNVGVALEDITANLTGYILLTAPVWVAKGA
jgi:hypothetical protein